MKKLFFIIGLFFSLSAMAQPTNYTKINMRYRWLSGMFDSALYVPRYNGTPSGVRVNETSVFDGMVAMDTTNNRLYIYSGGAWVRLANYSEIAAYTAGNGLTLSGSQFKLGSPLTENTTITTTGYDFNLVGIPTVGNTTGRKVALIDTSTGKVERIDPASLATTSLPISSLTAATGTNDINNGANQQTWRWNNKGLGHGIFMVSNSTSQPTGENGALLSISLVGTHSNSSVISTGIQSNVTNIGTSSTNRAAYFYAANATNNYAIIVPSGGGRVGIGTTTPNASALLDVTSTTQGAVLPRMNTTQMNAISSPVAGLMVYNSDSTSYCYYNGSAWLKMGSGVYTAGNGLTLSGSQFKLGGTLSENTHLFGANKRLTADSLNYFDFVSRPNTYASLARIRANGSFDEGTSGVLLSSSNEDNTDSSYLKVSGIVELRSWGQDIRLKNIPTVSSTTGRKVALIDTVTGKVERIDPASLVSTPTLQQVLTAGNTLTENSSINTDGYDFTIGNNTGIDFENDNEIQIYASNAGGVSQIDLHIDSIKLLPRLGVLNIDSLRTWSGISDTAHKKPMTWDTRNGRWEYAANWPQQKINLVFGAGSGADSDTTAFTTSAIYGSFYNDADTIVVTSMRSVLQGTSPDVTYKVWYNDSLNVEAGATALVTAGSQVTNTTTGTNVTSFDVTKIPPGVWVWVKTSTVATKPKYFSLTVNGYRK